MRSLVIFALTLAGAIAADLKTKYEWKYIEYEWKDKGDKQRAIADDEYHPENVIPYDAQFYKDEKVFITTPRYKCTNPASVSIISNKRGPGGPLLQPYPSWEWHVKGNCSGITSALKVAIDKCDRLWIVDSGKIGDCKMCPAQILAFCLKTNKLLLRHKIPEDVVNNGLLGVYDVETEGAHCEKTWVYCADIKSNGFVIFDGSKSWRLHSECLGPDPANLYIYGANNSIQPYIGTIGFVRIPEKFVNCGALVVWSFTDGGICAISLPDVHNSNKCPNNITWYYSSIKFPSQAGAGAVSKDGVGFNGYASENNLVCVHLPSKSIFENVVELIRNKEYLDFITSMKTFDDNCGKELLGVFTMGFSYWEITKIDCSKVNFRLLTVEVAPLIDCTPCAPTKEHFKPVPLDQIGFLPYQPHKCCN